MKNTSKISAVVVVAIIVVAGYFVMTAEASEWTVPWSNTTVFDGEWKTRLEVGFADGTSESFEDIQGKDSLTVFYGGSLVTQVTWYLEAKATTPAGNTPWDSCEIDLGQSGTLSLYTTIAKDTTLVHSNTDAFPLYDTRSREITVDNIYYTAVCSHQIALDTATADAPSDIGYTLTFEPSGTCFYRGLGIYYPEDSTDHSEWVQIAPPPSVSFTIDIENKGITVDFQSNVIWS